MWTAFCQILKQAIDAFVPKCGSNGKPQSIKRLYPRSVRKELFKKHCLWNKCRSQPDNITYRTLYRECCHKVRHLLRSTEEARELKVINVDNLGAFYHYVNHRLTNKSGISPVYDTQGELVSDNLGKANLLNSYFASVCTDDNSCLLYTSDAADE